MTGLTNHVLQGEQQCRRRKVAHCCSQIHVVFVDLVVAEELLGVALVDIQLKSVVVVAVVDSSGGSGVGGCGCVGTSWFSCCS